MRYSHAKLMLFFHLAFLYLPLNAAVFGEDNRHEIIDSGQFQLRQSVLAMVKKSSLSSDRDRLNFILEPTHIHEHLGMPFCEDVQFVHQPSSADCSGFYIGNNLLMTAGHCVLELDTTVKDQVTEKCLASNWITNYEKSNLSSNGSADLKRSDIYTCVKVVSGALTRNLDYAVIEIAGETEALTPLQLNPHADLSSKQKVSMAGYPSGHPLKYTDQATIFYSSNSASYFKTDLDAFFGNSGSPVFNEEQEVIGILTAGEIDYAIDSERGCAKTNICRGVGRLCDVYSGQYGALGSVVTKMKSVFDDWK